MLTKILVRQNPANPYSTKMWNSEFIECVKVKNSIANIIIEISRNFTITRLVEHY